jgi:hypothetical protein
MTGLLGGSVAELALETWVDCDPQGYIIDERRIPSLLPTIASKVPGLDTGKPQGGSCELFSPAKPGEVPLFCRLLRAQDGKVHFLYFWKAFGEASRLAGAPTDEGLTSELETLRDGILRRLEETEREPVAAVRPSASRIMRMSPQPKKPCQPKKLPIHRRSIPSDSLIAEVHRAASMSERPHFWQAVVISLSGQDEVQELGIENLTSVLLSWLHDAAMWQDRADTVPRGSTLTSVVQDTAKDADKGLRVLLHIYDVSQEEGIQRVNRILAHTYAPLKLGGVFHAGVEIDGHEWSFGYCPSETRSGVGCVKPKQHPQHHYRQTVTMRRTKTKPDEISKILSDLIEEYPGDDYDLLRRNCCHFADDFCRRLGVGGIPGWVHRLARMGASLDNMLQGAPQLRDAVYG